MGESKSFGQNMFVNPEKKSFGKKNWDQKHWSKGVFKCHVSRLGRGVWDSNVDVIIGP